jgi:hypothetical protein
MKLIANARMRAALEERKAAEREFKEECRRQNEDRMGKYKRKHGGKKIAQEDNTAPVVVDPVVGPAKVGPGQIYVRERSGNALNAPMRFNNVGNHPLDLAHARGKILSSLYAAGTEYRDMFELRARSGRDSTDPSPGGAGSTAPWTQTQADAINQLKDIEHQLKPADLVIVRKFCGEGFSMVEALRAANIPFSAHGVVDRVCEALELLGRAIISARRKKVA